MCHAGRIAVRYHSTSACAQVSSCSLWIIGEYSASESDIAAALDTVKVEKCLGLRLNMPREVASMRAAMFSTQQAQYRIKRESESPQIHGFTDSRSWIYSLTSAPQAECCDMIEKNYPAESIRHAPSEPCPNIVATGRHWAAAAVPGG